MVTLNLYIIATFRITENVLTPNYVIIVRNSPVVTEMSVE